jgi:hypothetical protein
MFRYHGSRDETGAPVVTWVLLDEHSEVTHSQLLSADEELFDWGEGDASALVDAMLAHALGDQLVCEECAGANTVVEEWGETIPCPSCGGQGATPMQVAAYDRLRQLMLNRMWALPRNEPWTISAIEIYDLWNMLLTVPPPEPVA